MSTTPLQRVIDRLYQLNGHEPRRSGAGWTARCPAHDDHDPSLSISEGDDGNVLLYCHVGCATEDIVAAIGLEMADLFPASSSRSNHANGQRRIVATYDYRDEGGQSLFQVVRYAPKDFRQRRLKPSGGWAWNTKGVRRVPYRLPELLADPAAPVFVVEGEKDVDNLAKIGVLATCNAGGAGKWKDELAEFLRGRIVYVVHDNDDAGRSHAEQVAQSLHGVAETVRIVALPDLPEKGDASDWLAAGGTKEELKRLAESAPVWTPDAQPWPEIVSFDVLDLPDFPTHVLPDPLRRWVQEESHATQTPADLAGMLALAVCSACIARRVVVKPCPGWEEPTNLFAAVLLGPGNRKSAVFTNATKPLREVEAELIKAAQPEVARAESERRQAKKLLEKLEKKAVDKGDAEARYKAGNLAAELAKQAEPVLPRRIVDDATAEELGRILGEQGGRIASLSPEGGVFDLMAGMYSKNGIPKFDVYLKGHAGDDLITDRVTRKNVRVERPALTCGYAIQPQVIRGLAQNPAFRGRGLLARFLYAAPRSLIGGREIAPTPVSAATREEYRQIVRGLAEAEDTFDLHLSRDAVALLRDWEADIEAMLAEGGEMELMRDWGGKLAGATLRLAAVLHCVEYGEAEHIDEPTMAAAVEIARYLIPHAEAVLNMMVATESSADADARYVLRWIERHGRREFAKRDAQQDGKRRFPKADDIDPALKELTRRGYIRLRPAKATGPGRPQSPAFEVNPAALASDDAGGRSQNSQNSPAKPVMGNSENIEGAFGESENTDRVQVTI